MLITDELVLDPGWGQSGDKGFRCSKWVSTAFLVWIT